MREIPGKRIGILTLSLVVVLAALPIWQTYRLVKQERLNKALIAAIKQSNTHAALSLLNQGADPNAQDIPTDRRSIWQRLWDSLRSKPDPAREKAPTALLVLLEPAVRIADYLGQYVPPLREENVSLARALLDKGARVNVRDAYGETPLLLAAKDHEHQTLLLLLDHDANVNVQDRFRYSPLHWVILDRDAVAAQRLLDRGAQIDAKDVVGRTPLMGAVESQDPAVVRLLLDRGTNVNLRDTDGETASTLPLKPTLTQTTASSCCWRMEPMCMPKTMQARRR